MSRKFKCQQPKAPNDKLIEPKPISPICYRTAGRPFYIYDNHKSDMVRALGGALLRGVSPLDELLARDLIIPPPELQKTLPQLAKDRNATNEIQCLLSTVETTRKVILGDARKARLRPDSIYLVVASPLYWTLKEYPDTQGQMGRIYTTISFSKTCRKFGASVFGPSFRVAGWYALWGTYATRKSNGGRHTVISLHAEIQRQLQTIGFDNLAPIIWYKIANLQTEVTNGSGSYLGKPYEPNGIVKNDIEFILMLRKPGGYKSLTPSTRILILVALEDHARWLRQIWADIPGASARNHPKPYLLERAERVIRMFGFVGDTVLDTFAGTITTQLATKKCGRNSIGIEIDPSYVNLAKVHLI